MNEQPTAPGPFFPGVPTEPLITPGAETTTATEKPGSRRRAAVGVVVGLGLLVAAFLGGRMTASNQVSSLADAIRQAQSGALPCGTVSGKSNKALQKTCAPTSSSSSGTKTRKKAKQSNSSGSGSSPSSSSSTSSSSEPTTTTTAPSTSTG
jgi:hypothetical protein